MIGTCKKTSSVRYSWIHLKTLRKFTLFCEVCNSFLASQEIFRFLWSPKFRYRVHKNPLLVSIVSHTIPPYSVKIWSSCHLRLGLPSGFFK